MRHVVRAVAVAVVTFVLATCGGPPPAPPAVDPPGRWFVQLRGLPRARGGTPAALATARAQLVATLVREGIPLRPRFEFEHLFHGVSLELTSAEVPRVRRLPDVAALFPVFEVEPPPQDPGPGNDTDLATAITMTGADVARNSLGLTGKGVVVAVIDTGIDYDHPDLGGCFGPTCRVALGWDFVGDAYDAAAVGTLPLPDADPDDCAGHGTHVAGIIGADGTVKGVATDVTFAAYRVFGCTGSTDSDIMLAAMERAYADGARVVNMSIGSAYQWPEYPTAVAANELAHLGVTVVASIGNSGNIVWSAGAPGVGDDVIGTGSIDNLAVSQPAFLLSPDSTKVGFNPATGAPPPPTAGTLPIVRTGTTTTVNDACAALPAGSLAGMAALIRRGTCSFYIKATNAMAAGAAAVVLYNNAAGQLSPTVAGTPPITIPVVAVTATDGALIDGRIQAGATTITWTTQTASSANPTAGQVSSFSSVGPTAELGLKPDLAAPGGSIWSTYPLELGGYASLSGTSMASPHVAGAVALLMEARPGLVPAAARALLQNTAVPAAWPGDVSGTTADTVARQGAGLIHIDVAALTEVTVAPASLPLGASAAGPATRTLTVANAGASAVTFDLGHLPAATLTPVPTYYAPTTAAAGAAAVAFDAPSVTVPAGGSATVAVTITADAALGDGGIYGGYVVLTPQGGGTTLRVPYLGYKGDYQALPVLTPTAGGYPWLAKRVSGTLVKQASGATYTLQSGDVPYVRAHFDAFAARVLLDVFDAVRNKPYGNALDLSNLAKSSTATGVYDFSWDGTTLFNKDRIALPNGTYVLKLSVLKALGDPTNPSHWETWTSPVVTLNHP